MTCVTFCLLLMTFLSLTAAYSGRVLIVSFDGFRWDYLNNIEGLVNFARLANEGVRTPYMNPTFATVTFPNHYSIATGLYQESHGVVMNSMYDPDFDAWFDMSNIESRWWDGAEPIWVTAVKQGWRSGTQQWPGSPVTIENQTATFFTEYNTSVPWKDRVDTMLDWFSTEGIDIGLLYFHEPDYTGHYHGPSSTKVGEMVREVDGHLGYLMDQLSGRGLEQVNLVVVSDHGMADTDFDRTIDLLDYISQEDTEVINNYECVCMILPKPNRTEAIIQALDGAHPHMHVYRKEAMPDRWHYRDHRRILPIQVVMDEGWQCTVNKSNDDWVKVAKGNHGWDNDNMSMKAIFLARGPDFRRGYSAPAPVSAVDVYPLLCELLGMAPAPNNGSLNHTRHMLLDSEHNTAAMGAHNAAAVRWMTMIAAWFIAMLGAQC